MNVSTQEPQPSHQLRKGMARFRSVAVSLCLSVVLCGGGGASNALCQATGGSLETSQEPQEAPLLGCFHLLLATMMPKDMSSAAPRPRVAPCVIPPDGRQINTSPSAKLNASVTVVLEGLREWAAAGNDPNRLRLYLAGRMLPDAVPILINRSQDYVNFDLKLSPDDRSLWVQVMTEARRQVDNRIPMSVGLQDEKQPFDSLSYPLYVSFEVYPRYTVAVLGLLVILLAALIWLGARYDLLRDTVAQAPPAGARRSYSLGRVQMAVWFFLVVAAFGYIKLITGEYNTLTSSILTLIGISAGTGLAAVFVDDSKATSSRNQRASLESQQAALEMRIKEIEGASPPAGSTLDIELQQKRSELARVKADLASQPPVPAAPVSKGLLFDLLGGGEDMSFHRFQMVVWTIVLALIFVGSVYKDLAMPNFDASLLGLMGISSGTYLGFKFPEKPK